MQPMFGEVTYSHAPGCPGLVLTSHRVRLQTKANGAEEIVSVMLDQITSCRLVRQSQPILLVFAAICGLGGLALLAVDVGPTPAVVGVLLAVIFVVSYLGRRREELVISSANGSIAVLTRGVAAHAAVAFVDAVETAKNQRYLGRGV